MKFFTVFAAILSVALGSQASWTLQQLSEATQNPNTNPALLPYLEDALNQMMAALHAGEQIEAIAVTIPSIDLSSWTLAELSDALQNPNTDAALIPYLEQALNAMMVAIVSETPQQVSPVIVPAMDVTSWTLAELNAALGNPTTDPALMPYLEQGLNEIMHALVSGVQIESVAIAIPASLLPVQDAPAPIVPAPVESPIAPAPVETPVGPAPSSPLVQIIININQQADSPVAPAPVVVEQIPTEIVDVTPVVVGQLPTEIVDVTPVVVGQLPTEIIDVSPVIIDQTPAVQPVIIGNPVLPIQVVDTPAVEPVIVGSPALPIQVVETPAVDPVIVGSPVLPIQVVETPAVEPVIIGAPVIAAA